MREKRTWRDTGTRPWLMANGSWLSFERSHQPSAVSHDAYFLSSAMTPFACAASGDVGSTAMTFSSILIVPSLSPLFSETSASLNTGLPQAGSLSAAFWYHVAASSDWPFENLTSPRL